MSLVCSLSWCPDCIYFVLGFCAQLLIDIKSLPCCSEEAKELYHLLRQPHLQVRTASAISVYIALCVASHQDSFSWKKNRKHEDNWAKWRHLSGKAVFLKSHFFSSKFSLGVCVFIKITFNVRVSRNSETLSFVCYGPNVKTFKSSFDWKLLPCINDVSRATIEKCSCLGLTNMCGNFYVYTLKQNVRFP